MSPFDEEWFTRFHKLSTRDQLAELRRELNPDLVPYISSVFGGILGLKHPLVWLPTGIMVPPATINLMYASAKASQLRLIRQGKWGAALFGVAQPYQLPWLYDHMYTIPLAKFRQCLATAWTLTEFPRETPRKQLLEMFQHAQWTHDGESALRAKPGGLADQFELFRGVGTARPAASRGLSWTSNIDTAQWFARRFEGMGVVYRALVPVNRLYGNFTGRGESEYIADVRGLKLERIS